MALCILPAVRYVVYEGKYLLAEQKSGAGRLGSVKEAGFLSTSSQLPAIREASVPFFLVSSWGSRAPRRTNGQKKIYTYISLMHYLSRLDRGRARNDRVARRHDDCCCLTPALF